MSDVKNIQAKLEVIKEMSDEKSVKQLADVMIEYIKSTNKDIIGFKKELEK